MDPSVSGNRTKIFKEIIINNNKSRCSIYHFTLVIYGAISPEEIQDKIL
jgi:hypothetical protein